MDWSALVPVLANLAPVAGKIIGGALPFPFAGFVAEQFGNAIAAKFGTKTPQQTAAAIQADPTAVAKINAAMEESRTRIQGFVEIEKAAMEAVIEGLRQTGQTMRVELLPENRHWFFTGWRPAIGWTFVFVIIEFALMLGVAGWQAAWGGNPKPLTILTEAWPLFAAFLATIGLAVGVMIPSRSYDKGIDKQVAISAAKAGVIVEAPTKAQKGGQNPVVSQETTRPGSPGPSRADRIPVVILAVILGTLAVAALTGCATDPNPGFGKKRQGEPDAIWYKDVGGPPRKR